MRKLTLVGLLATLTMAIGADAAPARPRGKIIVNSGESLQCPAGSAACVVTVQATGHNAHSQSVALGTSTITVAPAATTRLIFTLDGPAKRMLLSGGPLEANLTVTVRHGSDAPIVASHPITIGVPSKRHSHKR
jgi:hypothetical protein